MLSKISEEGGHCESDGGKDAPEENAFDAHLGRMLYYAAQLPPLHYFYFILDAIEMNRIRPAAGGLVHRPFLVRGLLTHFLTLHLA